MTAIEKALPPQQAAPPFAWVRRISLVRLIAWAALVATYGLLALDIVVWSGQRFRPPPVSFIQGQAVFVVEMFYAAAYGLMGWLLATRLPRNPLGWLFEGLGLMMAASLLSTFLVQQGHQIFRPLEPLLLLGAWAGSSLHLPAIIMINATIFAIFPHGKTLSRRWAWGVWAAVAGAVMTMIVVGTAREGLLWYPSLPNPFAAPAAIAPLLSAVGVVGLVLLVGGVAASAGSIAVRYRRSNEEEKAQVRWIALAVLLLAGVGMPFVIARYGLRVDYGTGAAMLSIALAAAAFLPVAAAIAITRNRLYDIDVIISRALVYIPLTGVLGGLYAAGVALFQRIFVAVTGDTSDAAIIITTLVLASVFTPARNHLQTFVDKRFKPTKEPAAETPHIESLSDRVAQLEERLARLERD